MTHNLLKGKRGIIFGALNEHSIAWKVAVKAVEEGATITLSNTPVALRMGELNALSEQLNAPIIALTPQASKISRKYSRKANASWEEKSISCCIPLA